MFIFLIITLVSNLSMATEKTCGLFEVSVWNGEFIVNIADHTSYAGKQQNFRVLNPLAFDWQSDSCICVEGSSAYDPEYGNDYLYMQINVTKKVSEDSESKSCK